MKEWKNASELIHYRSHSTAITMKDTTFIFGGFYSQNTSEILRHGDDMWVQGPPIPFDFEYGCGVKISDNELVLIGGGHEDNSKVILKLDTLTKKWHSVSLKLQQPRSGHKCIKFNQKVIITGGRMNLTSTEVIDLSQRNNWQVRYAGNTNIGRLFHSMAIINVDNVPTVSIFSGNPCDTQVEVWNDHNETWEITDKVRPIESRGMFSHVTIEKNWFTDCLKPNQDIKEIKHNHPSIIKKKMC